MCILTLECTVEACSALLEPSCSKQKQRFYVNSHTKISWSFTSYFICKLQWTSALKKSLGNFARAYWATYLFRFRILLWKQWLFFKPFLERSTEMRRGIFLHQSTAENGSQLTQLCPAMRSLHTTPTAKRKRRSFSKSTNPIKPQETICIPYFNAKTLLHNSNHKGLRRRRQKKLVLSPGPYI